MLGIEQGRIDVIYMGTDRHLYDLTWRGKKWENMKLSSTKLRSEPSVYCENKSVIIYFKGFDGKSYIVRWDGKGWAIDKN
jgi:hypothetical protein